MCNTDPCDQNSDEKVDFREEQCSVFNTRPIRGHYFQWLPYTDINEGITESITRPFFCISVNIWFLFYFLQRKTNAACFVEILIERFSTKCVELLKMERLVWLIELVFA